MDPTEPRFQRIAFDHFEVDLSCGELRKNGRRVRLQAQPFQLLALLLEHAGEVVMREEVCCKLWHADTFVDFDHSLGTAINKIREALNDSAGSPRFIETLPRRGYRFIGEIAPQAQPPIPAESRYRKPSRSRRVAMAAGILVGVLCALAVMFAYRSPRSRQAPTILTALPFTAFPGVETSPAFSPDGSRIVFAWNGDPASSGAQGFDLYVKAIGSETLLRLTQHPSDWISPAWSPDGTQIAFHRMAGADTGIYVVPALGGPERKLRSTRIPYLVAAPMSWSPDGKWIGFSDPLPDRDEDRIFLLSVETLETRQVSHNPKCLHEARPTFSHAGDRLAYLCVRSLNEMELYSVAPFGGTPTLITTFSNRPAGFTWSADDSELFLSLFSDGGPVLYEVALADGSLRRLDFARSAVWLALSPKGDKFAYSTSSKNTNIWRKDLHHPEVPAVKLISSTQQEDDGQYSPDGKHIAFQSTRAGSSEIWMSDVDGDNVVQISNFKSFAGRPRWSPDGKQIMFDSHRSGHFEIYIADISERIPRKLVTNLREVSAASWSHDGKWIYFRSYEGFGHKINRCPAVGGDAFALSEQPDGISPQESYDGDVLYFAMRNSNARLRIVSLKHAFLESTVEGLPPVVHENLWTVVPGGIYFVPADAAKSLRYFDFATKQISEVFKLDKDFDNGLSVSPDGRWLLYSQVDEENSDIMLVDHFS